jgi:hypothetical protein
MTSWTFRKQPGFFDVVTYTGNSDADQVVSHNLGTVPGFIIVKNITTAGKEWSVFHRSINNERYGFGILNQTLAFFTSTAYDWNPTETTFTADGQIPINDDGETYVAYLFAHDAQDFGTGSDESIIKCGSYTGNGSSDGPEIDLGFEPQWLLLKRTDATQDWFLFDNMRGFTAVGGNMTYLSPNLSSADGAYAAYNVSPTANGFKLNTSGSSFNASGGTYMYVAIRRPHKPASELEATGVFSVKNYAATTSSASVTHDVAFDMEMSANRDVSVAKFLVLDHLRGMNGKSLTTRATDSESSFPTFWSRKDQFTMYAPSAFDSWWAASSGTENHISYALKRAPGFFDVVAYAGTNSGTQNVNHNLGVTPELMIGKGRDYATNWYVFVNGVTDSGFLQSNGSFSNSYRIGTPTSTTFEVRGINSTATSLNGPHDYIAYLFATVAGISKVGTYSGTGSNVDVDCGFTSGARFVLVKRTDSTGDWYVWDSVRGIVAGNDPYLLLNSSTAQVVSTDYIDPLSSGFTITSSAPAALNASGGSYLFLAIA